MWRFVFLLLACPLTAYAGAWLQPKGSGYSAAQASFFASNHYFDDTGSRQDQARFSKVETNLYAEYGLYDWLTVGTNLFMNRAAQSGKSNIGLADSEFFTRTKLLEYEGVIASIQPLIKLPSTYQHDDPPRAGSKSFDGELSLLVGSNMPILGNRDYMDARFGYRTRSRGLAGQYRIDFAYGIHVSDTFTIIPAYRSVIAASIDEDSVFREDGEQDYDLHKIELGFAWEYAPKQQALLSVYSHVAGAYAGAGEGISIGLGWQF